MSDFGDAMGQAFSGFGSSIGNLGESMRAEVGNWVAQAVDTVQSSVPLLAVCILAFAIFVLWFLRRAI